MWIKEIQVSSKEPVGQYSRAYDLGLKKSCEIFLSYVFDSILKEDELVWILPMERRR